MTSWSQQFGISTSWTFSAPGHGKGTWDGVGGIIKSTARRTIIAQSLILNDANTVYELVKITFTSETKKEAYNKKNLKIRD